MEQESSHRFPALRWLDADENMFGVRCLDVRGITRRMKAWSGDSITNETFARLRRSTGKEYRESSPEDCLLLDCCLCYPLFPGLGIGPVFKAHSMEDKWDIYLLDDHYLYFCRSWTGSLIFRTKVKFDEDHLQITQIEVPERFTQFGSKFPEATVDFLIKSHLFGLDVPVYVPPQFLPRLGLIAAIVPTNPPQDILQNFEIPLEDRDEIVKYVFREFGRQASFATFSETTGLTVIHNRAEQLSKYLPYGLNTLKSHNTVRETSVECPVKGCEHSVQRQKVKFRRKSEFQCPEHHIYISPSTFEYPEETDNLLWKGLEDQALLRKIKTVKRECRMARDNSEDALTWNIFRYLEKSGLLLEILSEIHGRRLEDLQVFYWSYDPVRGNTWQDLETYRKIFGELPQHGSEPDVIIKTKEVLFFIESKLTATHETTPSNPAVGQTYTTAVPGWFDRIFRSNFETIAIKEKKYELLRFWLLGSRMADRAERAFSLLTVSRSNQAELIDGEFGRLIIQNEERKFISKSWEGIYSFILQNGPPILETQIVLAYIENKTTGYDPHDRLRRAFDL
ncbi:MAG: hypothetical protein PHQ40_16950 [Anaerolineaceae bacterium]|nr:hypothetical protein [Anaerolineaceae bacterium]